MVALDVSAYRVKRWLSDLPTRPELEDKSQASKRTECSLLPNVLRRSRVRHRGVGEVDRVEFHRFFVSDHRWLGLVWSLVK